MTDQPPTREPARADASDRAALQTVITRALRANGYTNEIGPITTALMAAYPVIRDQVLAEITRPPTPTDKLTEENFEMIKNGEPAELVGLDEVNALREIIRAFRDRRPINFKRHPVPPWIRYVLAEELNAPLHCAHCLTPLPTGHASCSNKKCLTATLKDWGAVGS